MQKKFKKINLYWLFLFIAVAFLGIISYTHISERTYEYSAKYVSSNLDLKTGYLKPNIVNTKGIQETHTLALPNSSSISTISTDLSDVKAAVKAAAESYNDELFDVKIGGEKEENAQIIKDILSGKETGPKKDIVCLNAGIGLDLVGKVDSIEEGIALAKEMIESGKAQEKLEEFISETNAVE